MIEYAQVDTNNLIVGACPLYYAAPIADSDNPKLANGQPTYRPVVYQAPTYDPTKQKLGSFSYAVNGSVVVKTVAVLDLSADEIATATTNTKITQYRQAYPYPETQLAVFSRISQALLDVCDKLTGVGMQPVVTDADRAALKAIAATAKTVGF